MRQVAGLVEGTDDDRVVVLSAVAGTTNALVEIARLAAQGSVEACRKRIEALADSYVTFVDELYEQAAYRKAGHEVRESIFSTLSDLVDTPFKIVREKEILSIGEIMSTRLFDILMSELQIPSKWLSALDFMRTAGGEPDMKFIEENISPLVANGSSRTFITQGFICRNEYNEVDNLKRGGSDYTASIIGAALNAAEIQIWTDIDGIHNNDPRVVENTRPIQQMSFDEAAEMAYFGAKVLHPSTVHPAKQKNIPVRLLNTMQPAAKGTLISESSGPKTFKAKAVAAKDGITAINIRSHRMLMAYGFLRKVFEVFERYSTPIDMITTSEVALSVTIDDDAKLDSIVDELSVFSQVEVDRQQTIVCVVGDFSKDEPGIGISILEGLRNIPIRMISSGGSESNISILIHQSHKQQALEQLNINLFLQ